ncbi:MAG TPA: hypothetical protein DD979_00495, partial [Gammaproteobacteria bacterium]|nr:hypothetical protein [Gammaproteobacteria bacterium]
MSIQLRPAFRRTQVAICASAACCALAGISHAAHEPRTPVAGVDDAVVINSPDPVNIDVLANDGDVDAATLQIATQPSTGSVQIVGGAIVYTPSESFNVSDSFTYTVTEADWRATAAGGEFALTNINAVAPIATSYTANDSSIVPIYNGGSLDVNSIDLSAEAQGSWNDAPVDGGVVGRSWAINQTVDSIPGCNVGDNTAEPITLTMLFQGRRNASATDPGGNQFTITSDAAPSPDVDGGGLVLKAHKSIGSANPNGEPDNIAKNGSSVSTTNGGPPSFGGQNWDFDATAIWTGLSGSDIESMNVTVLASLFNEKQWFVLNPASFKANVDLTQCNLATSTMTVRITGDLGSGGNGSNGTGNGSNGSNGGDGDGDG